MFSGAKNVEELRRLYESETPVLPYTFKRRAIEDWTPEFVLKQAEAEHAKLQ
jgi:hypothetical protein